LNTVYNLIGFYRNKNQLKMLPMNAQRDQHLDGKIPNNSLRI
jgi:hypothetical protein